MRGLGPRSHQDIVFFVMAGLVPAIYVFASAEM
jgi:hypothetical protein